MTSPNNITYRQPCRVNSFTDETDERPSLFDTTMMSLPNESLDSSHELVNELHEQIKSLNNELLSAHQEIENLNTENFRLKNDLQNSLKLIEAYKKICLTPERKNMSPKLSHKKNTSALSSPVTFSVRTEHNNCTEQLKLIQNLSESLNQKSQSTESLPATQSESPKVESSEKQLILVPRNDSFHASHAQGTLSGIDNEERQSPMTSPVIKKSGYKTNKIIVFGDQQGYRIRQTLQKLLGDNFVVSSYWKSGAQIQQVLSSAQSEINELDKNDFIVILGGINDKQPNDILFSMRNFLTYTNNTNVIVSEIPYNKFLNEKKLNYELKFVCSKYSHCTFIDMNYCEFIPDTRSFALHKCRSLLKEILHIGYKFHYEQYKIKVNDKPKHSTTLMSKSTQTDITPSIKGSNDFFLV